MELLTVTVAQRRAIRDILEQAGLHIASFDWETKYSSHRQGRKVNCLRLRGSPYYYKFDADDRQSLRAEFCPGEKIAAQTEHPGDWGEQFREFCRWVNRVVDEIQEPDPWDQIKQYIPDSPVFEGDGSENSAFSYPEVERIMASLDRLQLGMKEQFELSDDQTVLLNQAVTYLKEQAKKQGRINWKQIFIGTMVTLTIKLALPPDARTIVWDLVRQSFGIARNLIAP